MELPQHMAIEKSSKKIKNLTSKKDREKHGLFCMEKDRFHLLTTDIKKPKKFNNPFFYKPHALSCLAAAKVIEYLESQKSWQEELSKGKMFGVLVVEDKDLRLGFFAAFSGLLLGSNNHEYFVPPVFDMLSQDGHFKKEEARIDAINERIKEILSLESYKLAIRKSQDSQEKLSKEIEDFNKSMKEAKAKRDLRRNEGTFICKTEEEKMIRESQFFKAELKRKKKLAIKIQQEADKEKNAIEKEIDSLKRQRKEMSDKLQYWLFSQYEMLNLKGEKKDLISIFKETPQGVPPAGAGDCCAPKLLQHAFISGFKPILMAEFWWGESPKTEIRHHLKFYPACRGKCLPILRHMLQGLDLEESYKENFPIQYPIQIVYEDDWLMVVNKPVGINTVKGKDGKPSLEELLGELKKTKVYVPHRLDMDTSGLIVIAKDLSVYKSLQKAFALRQVKKRYIALLDGKIEKEEKGSIDLPLWSDPLDRPYQKVNPLGKRAITNYEVLSFDGDLTRIALYPLTGRTHQLRIHAAHKDGLGVPIKGDRLYGKEQNRLYLHAETIEFLHPITSKEMKFYIKEDF